MRACSKCDGRGKIAVEFDDYDFDYVHNRYYSSKRVTEEVCRECKGRGLVQSRAEGRPMTRAETEIFASETDHWDVEDWEWLDRFTEFREKFQEHADVSDGQPASTSLIDKLLALRKMTVANGATAAEAATALRILTELMSKHALSDVDLDQFEARRA